ncbi:MAG TPA: type II toxin-antitoxin system RelE/ParE family toxin [Allosphingosinicella sp.]|jgi:putative addiction module killer protein
MAEVVETEAFAQWMKRLRDPLGRRAILRRIARIVSTDNFGDHAGVGDGVSELRVDVGPGYRVYYTIREGAVVLLLCGGDKDSQERDIRKAKEMAAELDEGRIAD